MAGPFRCKKMRVIVHDAEGLSGVTGDVTLGVVEGLSIELIKEGGIEYHYDAEIGKHSAGVRHATFTIRRWFKADADTDLLFDLFNAEMSFGLSGQIAGQGGSTVFLSDCRIYRWRPITGAVGDIIAEEAVGEAVDWACEEYPYIDDYVKD